MKIYNEYNKRTLWFCLLGLGFMVVALQLTGGSAAIIFPVVAFAALSLNKIKTLFFVIIMMIVATIGNQFLMPKNMVFALSVRGTLASLAIIMAFQNAGQRDSRYLTPLLGILPYIIWECFSSANGWAPLVSYLKILLFLGIYFAFYMIANKAVSANRITIRDVRAIVLSISLFIIGGSAVLLFFPSIGMMNLTDFDDPARALLAVSLFKGMTMHSQSLGPIVAGLATIIFADLIFSIRRWSKIHLVLFFIAPYIVLKTSSRTAMGALIGGIGVAIWFFIHSRGYDRRWKGKVVSVITITWLFMLCAFLVTPSARQGMKAFLVKASQAEKIESVSFEEVVVSRQALMDEAMYNFKKKPLLGNGFQVSEVMQSGNRGSLKEYLSAPVEKGVWVSAVLEEGGVVGFALFAGFLLFAIRSFAKRRAYIAASVLIVVTLANMGEFVFFSMSYTGGLLWLLVFCAAVLDAHREMQVAPWMNFRRFYPVMI